METVGLVGLKGAIWKSCEDINWDCMVEAHENQALYISLDVTGWWSLFWV